MKKATLLLSTLLIIGATTTSFAQSRAHDANQDYKNSKSSKSSPAKVCRDGVDRHYDKLANDKSYGYDLPKSQGERWRKHDKDQCYDKTNRDPKTHQLKDPAVKDSSPVRDLK